MDLILRIIQSRFGKFAALLIALALLSLLVLLLFPGTYLWVILGNIVILILVAIFLLVRRQREKAKAEELNRGIVAGFKKSEDSTRPDRRGEVTKIRENFEFAVNLLRNGPGLYNLPWYVVIGPPASGKSTAIRNSGINRPIDPRLDETGVDRNLDKVDGAGGTKSCNWWFTSHAVILDTAGRWTTQERSEADRGEWIQFLDQLQRHRSRKPINGIIAFCSLEDVLKEPGQIAEVASTMKRRLHELMSSLRTHVPVYLVFNKCDRMHGFVEFFRDLSRTGRLQVWGFTRHYRPRLRRSGDGLESDRKQILDDVEREMNLLAAALDQRRLIGWAAGRPFASERVALHAFPEQFRQITGSVQEFVNILFEDNPYGNNPILRGVYFTSATQVEGSPIASLMQQIVGEYNIPAESLRTSSETKVNAIDTYFIHDLFSKVVFDDKFLGGRFKRSVYDRARLGILATVVILTLFLTGWMLLSYRGNGDAAKELQLAFKSARFTGGCSLSALASLSPLRAKLDSYLDYSSLDFFTWVFGRYRGQTLTESASGIMQNHVATILNCVADKLTHTLDAPVQDFSLYYSSYRTYLYLSTSQDAEKIPSRQAAGVIYSYFGGEDSETKDSASAVVMIDSLLQQFVEGGGRTKLSLDQSVLQAAQRKLETELTARKLVHHRVRELTPRIEGLRDEFRNWYLIANSENVPLGYTNSAWDSLNSEILAIDSVITNDAILSDLLRRAGRNYTRTEFVGAYIENGVDEWKRYFDRLEFDAKVKTDNASFREVFSGTAGQYFDFLFTIARQTNFSDKSLKKLRDSFKDLHRFAAPPPGGSPLPARFASLSQSLESLNAGENCSKAISDFNNDKNAISSRMPGNWGGAVNPLVRLLRGGLDAAIALEVVGEAKCKGEETGPQAAAMADILRLYPFDKSALQSATLGQIDEAISAAKLNKQLPAGTRRAFTNLGALMQKGKITLEFVKELYPPINQIVRIQIIDQGGSQFNYRVGSPQKTYDLGFVDSEQKSIEIKYLQNQQQPQSVKILGPWVVFRLLDKSEFGDGAWTLPVQNGAVRFRLKFDEPDVVMDPLKIVRDPSLRPPVS